MTGEPATEQDVSKLREWVDDLRIKQPLEAPKASTVADPNPQQRVLKAPYEPTEGAKRVQKIIEAMDLRRQERARQIGALKSRHVEVEREDRAACSKMESDLKALKDEFDRRTLQVQNDYYGGISARKIDLDFKLGSIEKLDATLANFRKQLDAELLKLDPERGEDREKGEAK